MNNFSAVGLHVSICLARMGNTTSVRMMVAVAQSLITVTTMSSPSQIAQKTQMNTFESLLLQISLLCI